MSAVVPKHWSVLIVRRLLRRGTIYRWQCRRCGEQSDVWYQTHYESIKSGNKHVKVCSKA